MKDVKWKVQEMAIEALREDGTVGWHVKVRLEQRDRTVAVCWAEGWTALYGDDSGLVWDTREFAPVIYGVELTHPHVRGTIWHRSKCMRALLVAASRSLSEPLKGDNVCGG